MRLLSGLAALLLGGAVLWLGGPAWLEAWLPPFMLLTGLVVGALGTLVLGHVLGEEWLRPLRPALEAAARTAPLLLLLALPLLAAPAWIYPWAADPSIVDGRRALWFAPLPFAIRTALLLLSLVLVALLVARPHVKGLWTAWMLVLLLPAALLLPQDLVMSRDMEWFGSLQGTATAIEQVAAALSAAVLVALWRGGGDAHADMRGAERALLTFALLTMWLWFVQFVVVWMADIPYEAGWYLRRGEGTWLVLKLLLLALLAAAIVVGIPPDADPKRLAVIAGLLLALHLGHLWWLVRPDAHGGWSLLLDLLLIPALLATWAAWWWGEFSRYPDPLDDPAEPVLPATATAR